MIRFHVKGSVAGSSISHVIRAANDESAMGKFLLAHAGLQVDGLTAMTPEEFENHQWEAVNRAANLRAQVKEGIRHGMTVIGGYMVASGYADETTWQTITGGAVAAGGLALSFGEKALYPRFQ